MDKPSKTSSKLFELRRKVLPAIFWSRVDVKNNISECWPWKGPLYYHGYGTITVKRPEKVGAHRMAYELTFGKIPAGKSVCHHCDNRACCNPLHLFVGDQIDNVRNAIAKGRMKPFKKLTEEQVIEIKRMLAAEVFSQKHIGEKFNVEQTTISAINRGINWSQV